MADHGLTWGVLPAGTFERLLVFSPHFDDAAMGAGHLLLAHPGATVGHRVRRPTGAVPGRSPRSGTRSAGSAPVTTSSPVRRAEDDAALAVLDARAPLAGVRRPPVPRARGACATPERIAPALAAAIDAVQPTAVVLPLGLANPDHVATHDAGMLARGAAPRPRAGSRYEDAGYKHIPGMLAWRISKLFRSDLWPTPMIVPTEQDHARKRAAIECYRSQLGPLNRDHALAARIDGNVPEQFWMLAPPPPGWERMRDA